MSYFVDRLVKRPGDIAPKVSLDDSRRCQWIIYLIEHELELIFSHNLFNRDGFFWVLLVVFEIYEEKCQFTDMEMRH